MLVDSERIANRELARLLCELGLPTTMRESMDRYMGNTLARCVELIEASLDAESAPFDRSLLPGPEFLAMREHLATTPQKFAATARAWYLVND